MGDVDHHRGAAGQDGGATMPTQTALGEWVSEAQEIMKPILDGWVLTNRFQDVEKEAMGNVLDMLDDLVKHFKTIPSPCNCADDESCVGWQTGYDVGYDAGVEAGAYRRTE